MKANELRIGNLLNKINDNKFIEVTSLEIECCEGMNGHFNLTFEPIPITEELLLKCGFEYTDAEKEFLQLSVFRTFKFNADNSDNFSSVTFRINDTTIEITSIHQLQNIFFALTNQELKIFL